MDKSGIIMDKSGKIIEKFVPLVLKIFFKKC